MAELSSRHPRNDNYLGHAACMTEFAVAIENDRSRSNDELNASWSAFASTYPSYKAKPVPLTLETCVDLRGIDDAKSDVVAAQKTVNLWCTDVSDLLSIKQTENTNGD